MVLSCSWDRLTREVESQSLEMSKNRRDMALRNMISGHGEGG